MSLRKDTEGHKYLNRKLEDDNTRGTVQSGDIPVGYDYVKALAVDAWDEGKEQSVAELYYQQEEVTTSGGGGGAGTTTYNWALKLSLVDARGELTAASEPLTLLAKTGMNSPLLTQYYKEHTYLNMTAETMTTTDSASWWSIFPTGQSPSCSL